MTEERVGRRRKEKRKKGKGGRRHEVKVGEMEREEIGSYKTKES